MMELLNKENTCIVVIDIQQNLMPVMSQKQRLIDNISKLLQLSKIFNIPVILTEQYPKWLGPTIPEISELLNAYEPIPKLHFNCCEEEAFNDNLNSKGYKINYIIYIISCIS